MKKIKFPHMIIALCFFIVVAIIDLGLYRFFMQRNGYTIPIINIVFLIILIVPQIISFVLGAVWLAGQRHYTIEEMIISIENQRTCEFIIFQAEQHKNFLKERIEKQELLNRCPPPPTPNK